MPRKRFLGRSLSKSLANHVLEADPTLHAMRAEMLGSMRTSVQKSQGELHVRGPHFVELLGGLRDFRGIVRKGSSND